MDRRIEQYDTHSFHGDGFRRNIGWRATAQDAPVWMMQRSMPLTSPGLTLVLGGVLGFVIGVVVGFPIGWIALAAYLAV